MNLEIIETKNFLKSVKKLAKKYKKFVNDLEVLSRELRDPDNNAINLGDNFYKIRLQNSSQAKGKNSGFRVVYFFKTQANEIYLLDIYSKNEVANINKTKLCELANRYHLS